MQIFARANFTTSAARVGWAVGLVLVLTGCGTEPREPAGTAATAPAAGELRTSTQSPTDAPPASAEASAAAPTATNATPGDSPVRQLVGSEELILQLTPRLRALTRDALNLRLPGAAGSELFHATAQGWPLLAAWRSEPAATSSAATELRHWQLEVAADPIPLDGRADLWHALFSQLAYLEHAKFGIVRGEFTRADWTEFTSVVSFTGLARRSSGSWLAIQIEQQLVWRLASPSTGQPAAWKVAMWRPTDVALVEAPQLMFSEVSAEAFESSALRQSLRESQHWIYATRHYYPKFQASLPGGVNDARFFPISTAYHPGLAVVDINADGWDDLYRVERWGRNLLLRNRGDGTFEEAAAEYGLDIDGRCNAAVFADFDNDGDPDLMLARGLERSLYLVNEQGRFVDRSTDLVAFPLPYEATSVSAADYNGDGLLDVYFATYHQDDISRRLDADLSHPNHRIHKTLTDVHSTELKRRFRAETQSFINQVGPPNILLTNVGEGRFELAKENASVAVWRNSFQGTWGDFDQDGDPDLYVASDFAADNLLRNDGAAGFRDVTRESGLDQLGFAMGASWGDYDNDGQFDLYASNMYSKAGQRITSQVAGLDPRIAQLANGNYLYRNVGNHFQLVSGLQPPQLTVARTGWSWGGQFWDANNDGCLDLYVPNGYYTVPSEFETEVDL